MKLDIAIGATAIAFAQCFAVTVLAQAANPAVAPAATAAVVQAQLNARAPAAGRISGAEADAIYKRYVTGIGQPMVSTPNQSANQSGTTTHSAGYQ